MKKQKKAKASKRSGHEKNELPELVTVMAKLVERLEALEKKTDLVLTGMASPREEMRQAPQNFRRSEFPEPQRSMNPQNGNPSRPMFEAVCADCKRSCEIPFRPTGERPVYCKECFARRKSGQGASTVIFEKSRGQFPESKSDSRGNKILMKRKKKR